MEIQWAERKRTSFLVLRDQVTHKLILHRDGLITMCSWFQDLNYYLAWAFCKY